MNNFSIIHQRGEPQEATTLHGQHVERQEYLWVPEWGQLVRCAPYDNHFVYATSQPEQSAYMCTCGSPAVVTLDDKARLFVCLFHATYGAHQTSFVNKKDFEKVAGETLEIEKPGKARWL